MTADYGRPEGGRIPSLDGLRAISILMVLFAHAYPTIPGTVHGSLIDRAAAYYGGIGVRIFFLISGYLITILLIRERNRLHRIDLPAFFLRRALRIWPAFFTYLGVVTALSVAGPIDVGGSALLAAATFTWNYAVGVISLTQDASWFLGHSWTLSLEEQFYLLWPPLLTWAGVRHAGFASVGLILLAPLSRVLTYWSFPSLRGQTGMMLHTAVDTMLIGCLCAIHDRSIARRFAAKPRFWAWAAVTAAAYLVIAAQACRWYLAGLYSLPLGLTLEGICIGVIVLWCAHRPTNVVGRILNGPIFVHLGIVSYSLYLWQQLFLTERNETWSGRFPVNLVVALLAAEASYWLVERPFLRLKARTSAAQPGRKLQL